MATLSVSNVGEQLDLTIRQGSNFLLTFAWTNPDTTPVDLTGSQFRAQIRKKAKDAVVVASFVCTITNAAGGLFKIELDDTVTEAIPAGEDPTSGESKYTWDMEWVDSSGFVRSAYQGKVTVSREVTRA